jgi:hypothetical protein
MQKYLKNFIKLTITFIILIYIIISIPFKFSSFAEEKSPTMTIEDKMLRKEIKKILSKCPILRTDPMNLTHYNVVNSCIYFI